MFIVIEREFTNTSIDGMTERESESRGGTECT